MEDTNLLRQGFQVYKKQTDQDRQIGQANLDPARGEAHTLEKQYWQQNNKKRPEW